MNLGEMSGVKLLGVLALAVIAGTAALYYTVFKSQRADNAAAQQKLEAKTRENAELEAYRPKLADIERQLANLKQQLDIERKIVPDEKEVDNFIRMVNLEANRSGIWIRRFTSKPVNTRDFYSEVPFEVELDGPYYSMLGFFDRVGKLERIVNVNNLLLASTKKPSDAKAKHAYAYAPNESVVATCQTTTYFSHDLDPNAGATGKPGQPSKPVQPAKR